MSGLRQYERDAGPLLASGDSLLAPPSSDELLTLVRAHLVRPDAPAPVAASWVYARWKPTISLTAGFQLAYADGRTRWVSWKRYADGKATSLAGRRRREIAAETVDELLHEHALISGSGAHLWALPFDRELPGLERALDLRRSKRWFLARGLFEGRRVRSGSSSAELLRYKPERRAVLRLDLRLRPLDGGPKTEERLGARALPPREAARVVVARRAWQQEPCGALAPLLVAYEARTGLLYEEWLDVESAAHDDFTLAPLAGALLGRLHSAPTRDVPAASQSSLSAAAAILSIQSRLAALVSDLEPVGRATGMPVVWTHGDFHPDQLARERETGAVRLLDLDRLGPGRALDDLASWVADHLVERPEVELGSAVEPLLDGYVASGQHAPRTAELQAAVAEVLVHRAAGALRRLESGAVSKAELLLERAREIAPKGRVFA